MSGGEDGARLSELWRRALENSPPGEDPGMDALVCSDLVGIRYAVVTQLLGKLLDPRRDALCLQAREGGDGRWNARTLCDGVVVPWVGREAGNVLGTSSEPYASKPLRRARLDEGESHLRSPDKWDPLVRLLREVQERDEAAFTEETLMRCLRSVARAYRAQSTAYPLPLRVSIRQVLDAISHFVEERSGGERPLLAAAACMRLAGERFELFDRVERQNINAPDAPSGAVGDISCSRGGELRLVVEVKDRSLSLREVRSTIGKARSAGLREILFVARAPGRGEEGAVSEAEAEAWSQGTSLHRVDLIELARVVLSLGGEDSRTALLRLVGEEINSGASQPALKAAWREALERVFGAGP